MRHRHVVFYKSIFLWSLKEHFPTGFLILSLEIFDIGGKVIKIREFSLNPRRFYSQDTSAKIVVQQIFYPEVMNSTSNLDQTFVSVHGNWLDVVIIAAPMRI